MSERDDDRAHIRAFLKTLNDAWTNGKPDAIANAMADRRATK